MNGISIVHVPVDGIGLEGGTKRSMTEKSQIALDTMKILAKLIGE